MTVKSVLNRSNLNKIDYKNIDSNLDNMLRILTFEYQAIQEFVKWSNYL
jgi:hypothetical protein